MKPISLATQPIIGGRYSWGVGIYELTDLQALQQDGWHGTFANIADHADRFVATIRPYANPAPRKKPGHLAELAEVILRLPPADARWQQVARDYVLARESAQPTNRKPQPTTTDYQPMPLPWE